MAALLRAVLLFFVLAFLLGSGIFVLFLRGVARVFARLTEGRKADQIPGAGQRRSPGHYHFGRSSRGTAVTGTMRPCALCGVSVPESEGVAADGAFFCSEEHHQAFLRPGG